MLSIMHTAIRFFVYIGDNPHYFSMRCRDNVRAAMLAIKLHARRYADKIAGMSVGDYLKTPVRIVEDAPGGYRNAGNGTVVSYSMVYSALCNARKLRQCKTCYGFNRLSDADVNAGETTCGACYKRMAQDAMRHKCKLVLHADGRVERCEYCDNTGYVSKTTPVQCGACNSFHERH